MNDILSHIYKYTIYYFIYSNDLGNSKFYPQASSSLPIVFFCVLHVYICHFNDESNYGCCGRIYSHY